MTKTETRTKTIKETKNNVQIVRSSNKDCCETEKTDGWGEGPEKKVRGKADESESVRQAASVELATRPLSRWPPLSWKHPWRSCRTPPRPPTCWPGSHSPTHPANIVLLNLPKKLPYNMNNVAQQKVQNIKHSSQVLYRSIIITNVNIIANRNWKCKHKTENNRTHVYGHIHLANKHI